VENQASDRAHRLGQQRPVTVNRFITRHTIEQNIADLHASKRDLANSVLEDAVMMMYPILRNVA
jgi:SNF2 family DNA or RNA helicase